MKIILNLENSKSKETFKNPNEKKKRRNTNKKLCTYLFKELLKAKWWKFVPEKY